VIGGFLNKNNEVVFGLKIPYALSILAHGTPNGEVKGLNDFPKDELPPLFVHYLFDGMVAIGIFLTAVALLYLLAVRRFKNPLKRYLLWAILISGPLALLAIEFGWIYAEIGRQPWILRGYMKTSQGATTSRHVGLMLILFAMLYTLLGYTSMKVLRRLYRNNPPETELERISERRGDKR
jgi:cytochrome d ubiquinol oxidase subunit I